jgi:putative peptide zinc metalloprotease protein
MSSRPSASTVEITNVAPALRGDLRFTLQKYGSQTCYLIEDEKNSRFFRVGIPEYMFISLLDGTTTIREAMAYTATQLGGDAFTERDAASICKWLVDSQLAQTEASTEYDRLLETAESTSKSKRLQWFNPLLIRLPLIRPDRIVRWATRVFGWWFSWPAFAVWIGVVLFSVHQVLTHWNDISVTSQQIFAKGNLLWLLVTWTALKIAHEFSHGIACKKFRGHVREAGLLFIILAPIPYVDVTSSWRLSSKWKRILVSAAGMYTEVFLAAIAAIVWVHSGPGVLHQQAYNIVITASLVTLLFNANPLMRFDGYYIFSDFCEVPNLYALGQQYTKYLGRRIIMGVPARLPDWSVRRAAVIKAYGVLALIWRLFICASLILAASTMLAGAGIVLAVVATVLWLGVPLVKLGRYLLRGNQVEKPNLVRFSMAAGLIAGSVIAIWNLPEPGGIRSPAIVRYEPLYVIRAPHNGFVHEVFVGSGADVVTDEPLVRIENPDLVAEVVDMRLEGKQSEQRSRIYRKDGDVAAMQVEEEMRDVLKQRITERESQLLQSTVTAPAGGMIVTRGIDSLAGRFVHEGEELFAIGVEDQKELEVSIAQGDMKMFSQEQGNEIDVLLKPTGAESIVCILQNVDPRASQQLPHPALAASNEGPLAVQPLENEQTDEQWQLVEPRFVAKVALDHPQSAKLRAGQQTTVRLRIARGNMGSYFYRGVTGWVERRLERMR